ncbi:hypothetical protein SUGI_0526180 [Cryptomeria japonica]|uniref:rho GDP-dissociation inhibitor 1 n=1 Tax=Cryptomeria japonica TaxID=3369 RepID=UPI002408EF65|nr:rho GDP-dissociation inhibitor 1 [Cryptomeria japonica]GLJ26895.1 hypothetical protein SUGI_0526180 [Cryptomeria japonica]
MSKMSMLIGSMTRNKSLACSGGGGEFKAEVLSEVVEHKVSGEPAGPSEKLMRQFSEATYYDSEEEEHGDAKVGGDFVVGPLLPLKEQLEKDKEDESLRRWKEQLLGSLDVNSMGERLEADVKIISFGILSAGRPDLIIPVPFVPTNSRGSSFILKEGSHYNLKICFSVHDNIVSGLTYINTVWKSGVRVDSTRVMLGTFSPQQEPYAYVMEEETTPSGIFARGCYSARTKFVDDDERCHLEINYTFEIRKDW